MSNKSDKRKQEELQRQQAQLNAEAMRDRAAVREKSELEKAEEAESLGYFNFLKDPNRDFSKLPGTAFSGMAADGAAGAEEDRVAMGAMQFGKAAADPNLQAVLASNLKQRKAERRGDSLERAVERYDAIMRGASSGIIGRNIAKMTNLANMTTGAGANALNNYAQFQVRPHWGLGLAAAGIGAAGSMFRFGGWA